jgi:peptidylglycine monooxygenase
VEAIWGGFFRPQSVWVNDAGLIFVTDAIPSLSLLSPAGERLGRCRPVLNGAHGLCGKAATGELFLAEGTPSRLTRLVPV